MDPKPPEVNPREQSLSSSRPGASSLWGRETYISQDNAV